MEDFHDAIVAHVRERLPEFCKRNGLLIEPRLLDNLASWVVGTMPAGFVRSDCSGGIPYENSPPIACACTGACQRWTQVKRRNPRPPDE
jgi:hypothetical protein